MKYMPSTEYLKSVALYEIELLFCSLIYCVGVTVIKGMLYSPGIAEL